MLIGVSSLAVSEGGIPGFIVGGSFTGFTVTWNVSSAYNPLGSVTLTVTSLAPFQFWLGAIHDPVVHDLGGQT